jgi:hypothetical protein
MEPIAKQNPPEYHEYHEINRLINNVTTLSINGACTFDVDFSDDDGTMHQLPFPDYENGPVVETLTNNQFIIQNFEKFKQNETTFVLLSNIFIE